MAAFGAKQGGSSGGGKKPFIESSTPATTTAAQSEVRQGVQSGSTKPSNSKAR